MDLTRWLGDRTDGWLASQIGRGCHPSTVSRIRRKKKKASLSLALAIESITDGMVTAEELPLTKRSRALLKTMRGRVALAAPEAAPAGEASRAAG